MRYLKTSLMVAAAGILAAGCDQQRQASNDRAVEQAKDAKETVQKSVRDAKSEVDKQARAQKDILDAESRAAQAKLDAEKARIKAAGTDAQGKVDAAAQNIRDAAAGGASTRVSTDTGAGRPATAVPPVPPSETTTPPTPPPTPTEATPPAPVPAPVPAAPTTANAESDQKLTEQVRSAVTGGGDDNAGTKTIQVAVSGGTVTLTGSVASDTEKAQAEQKAKAVSGVSKVDNQLQVKQ